MDGALLPEVTNHLMHNSVNDCSTISNSTQQLLYMFSVRDPVSRMMSWFTYERPLTPKWEWACKSNDLQVHAAEVATTKISAY